MLVDWQGIHSEWMGDRVSRAAAAGPGFGDPPAALSPPGLVPVPLSAVLGVAEDQPESPFDAPTLAEPSPRAPLPPLRQAHEEERG